MIQMILVALGLTALTVVIHGVGAAAAARWTVAFRERRKERLRRLAAELLMARLVGALLLLHLAEALMWGVFFVGVGALPDLETAAYFSLTSYTTVGYGDVVPPGPWRMLGPVEAAVGILMLGWSTGIIVAAIGTVYERIFAFRAGE